MAGYFVDTQMGFGFLTLINPFAEQQSSAMGTFQYQLAMTLYLLSNGHLLLLGALAESFQTLLPGGVTPGGAFGMTALPMLQQMMGLGFRLALPAAGVLFVVDVAFGLVARMVPQVNVFIVGIPAKIVLGLMTMALVLPAIALIVGDIVTGTMHSVDTLIRSVRVGH
jgi:flagellar biosynthetic protein FliR